MEDEYTAANAGADIAPEGVASPIADPATADNSVPSGPESPASSQGYAPPPAPDPEQTITQTVARRLKEATEKFHQEESPKLKQQARDEYIAEQKIEWPAGSGKYLQTEAEYKQAQRDNETMERYRAQGLPDEVIQRLTKVDEVERRLKDIDEQTSKQKTEQEKATRVNAMHNQFLTDYPEYASKEKIKEIPAEVHAAAKKWEETDGREGSRYSDAMAAYLYRQSRQQQQTGQVNEKNASSSTGSAKGSGPVNKMYTEAEVAKMSVEEIAANLPAIKTSKKHWK